MQTEHQVVRQPVLRDSQCHTSVRVMARVDDNRTTVVRVAAAIARAFHVSQDEILSRSKEQPVAFARQVTCWVLSDVCKWSSKRIGRLLGLDHSGVLHAFRTVENRITTEPATAELVIIARGLSVVALQP